MDLATGAKAAQRSVKFAEPDKYTRDWSVISSCYNKFEDGVAIHGLKKMAEAIEEPVKFAETGHFSNKYAGYYYIEMFGVRFYDLCTVEEKENDEGK